MPVTDHLLIAKGVKERFGTVSELVVLLAPTEYKYQTILERHGCVHRAHISSLIPSPILLKPNKMKYIY